MIRYSEVHPPAQPPSPPIAQVPSPLLAHPPSPDEAQGPVDFIEEEEHFADPAAAINNELNEPNIIGQPLDNRDHPGHDPLIGRVFQTQAGYKAKEILIADDHLFLLDKPHKRKRYWYCIERNSTTNCQFRVIPILIT